MARMKVIEELKPEWEGVLRHTFVQGRDGNHYKVITIRLYGGSPAPEFPNWEVNVEETDERGKRRSLSQPVIKRFFDRGKALEFHAKLVETFDDFLHLAEPKAPAVPPKPVPAAPVKPAPPK
jgi:hypothetical protein